MPHLEEERITALLDGELSPAEALEARDHLAGCAECAARFEEAKVYFHEADRLVRVLEFPEVAVPVQPPAPARVEPQIARRRFPLRQMAWAASLLLAVGLGYYGNEARVRRSSVLLDSPASQAPRAPVAVDRPDVIAETKSVPAPAQAPAARSSAEAWRAKDAAPLKAAAGQPAPAPSLANEKSLDKEEPRDERQAANDAAAAGQVAAGPPVDAVVASAAPVNPPLAGSAAGGARERADAQAKPAKVAPAALEADGRAGFAAQSAVRHSESAPVATKLTLEEAVQSLGGSIHLIDGLTPARVEQLSGRAVPGAQPDLAIIRVIYLDAPMRELWLDQQRGAGANTNPDTVLLHTPDGGLSLQWPFGADGWLSLTGHLTADSLRILARRVR